jgi:hypothetical protein
VGYIEARDGARAVRLALKSDLTATEVFIIASAETVMSSPNAALIAEFYPDARARHAALDRQSQAAAWF